MLERTSLASASFSRSVFPDRIIVGATSWRASSRCAWAGAHAVTMKLERRTLDGCVRGRGTVYTGALGVGRRPADNSYRGARIDEPQRRESPSDLAQNGINQTNRILGTHGDYPVNAMFDLTALLTPLTYVSDNQGSRVKEGAGVPRRCIVLIRLFRWIWRREMELLI